MATKAEIFNLALGALLLNKRISDTVTDTSTENQTLNVHYNTALITTLANLDLDSTSTQADLELIEQDPTDLWLYAYKYPSDCVHLRRLQNSALRDVKSNQIIRRVANHGGVKVIFTNQETAIIEYISKTISLAYLSEIAALAVAYRLAILSAPLISGKGAGQLRKEIIGLYTAAKLEAQQLDRLENANFESDDELSEFVEARTS